MRKDLRDGNGVEKSIVMTVMLPKDTDLDLVDALNDTFANDLYQLGGELLDVREHADERAFPENCLNNLSASFTLDNGLLVLIEKNQEGSFDFNIWEPEEDGSRGMLFSGGILPEEEAQTLSSAVALVCKGYSRVGLRAAVPFGKDFTPVKPALSEQIAGAKERSATVSSSIPSSEKDHNR